MFVLSSLVGGVVRYVLIVLIGLSSLQSTCFAGEQFRCGQWVVSQDIDLAELLKKCGEPTRKTSSSEDVWIRTGDGHMMRGGVTTTEVWTYDRGSRAFPMIVTIIDGRIDSMGHSRN